MGLRLVSGEGGLQEGRAIQALAAVGFGFIEGRAVSARPSTGNAWPSLFRIPRDEGIIVQYGVPNDGGAVVARRVARYQIDVPLGVNLVETITGREASAEQVVVQFVEAAHTFVNARDYQALNLNCPNTTVGHSTFDDVRRLEDMLREYARIAPLPPVFLKLVATHDPRKIEQTLRAVEPYDFVKGSSSTCRPESPID